MAGQLYPSAKVEATMSLLDASEGVENVAARLQIHFNLKHWCEEVQMVGRGRECSADCLDVLLLTCVSLLDSKGSSCLYREHWFSRTSPSYTFYLPVWTFALASLFVWRALSPIFAIVNSHCPSKPNLDATSSTLPCCGLR